MLRTLPVIPADHRRYLHWGQFCDMNGLPHAHSFCPPLTPIFLRPFGPTLVITNATGEESRKLGKENVETEMVNEGWGSGGGTHTVVEVDSSDTTSVVEVDSSDTTTTTVVESYVDSTSVDSAIVMTGGSGKSGGSGGSKSGTTSMFVGSKVR